MLDESCGMAVQLALDGTRAIATLDLRIDYQKPATPGLDIKAHSVCYRVTRSIAFVRSTAYQESEDDPVATARQGQSGGFHDGSMSICSKLCSSVCLRARLAT